MVNCLAKDIQYSGCIQEICLLLIYNVSAEALELHILRWNKPLIK